MSRVGLTFDGNICLTYLASYIHQLGDSGNSILPFGSIVAWTLALG